MEIRIYVADLEAYNSGRLVGQWVDLPCDSSELQEIMDRLTHDGQHDYAIHDYEAPFNIGEYDSPWKLNEMAETLADAEVDSEVLEVILRNASNIQDALNIIESEEFRVYDDCNDMEDVARALAEESGLFSHLDEHIQRLIDFYFDYAAYGSDMEINGTFWKGNGFYVEVFH